MKGPQAPTPTDRASSQSAAGQVDEVTRSVVTGCVVQLLLIDCVHNTFEKHAEVIPRPVIVTILSALESSFTFAHDFNQKISLRLELKRLGFMRDMRDLPGLLKQEREGLTCYLGILFGLYSMGRLDTELCEKLTFCSRSVIHNYVRKDRLMQSMLRDGENEVQAVEYERETTGLQPIITQVILHNLIEADANSTGKGTPNDSDNVNAAAGTPGTPGISKDNNTTLVDPADGAERKIVRDLFKTVCPVLFPLLADLCLATSSELRCSVREVLLVKVGPILGL